jgi:DNA replication protein DnaC
MLDQASLTTLRGFKLFGMAEALEQQLGDAEMMGLSFEERMGLLIDRESTSRENRRLTRLLRLAKLREQACFEDIDYRHPRGLQKSQFAPLAAGNWVRKAQNICLSGPTGSGKTFLACALGHAACRQGLSVRYWRLPRLFETLRIAHGDGSYARLLTSMAKTDLLILDDWGLQKPASQERHDLLEVLEDRYGKRATLVTSQLPVKNWHAYLGEPTVADAILDRLVHNAHKIQLSGDSMRKKTRTIDQRELGD